MKLSLLLMLAVFCCSFFSAVLASPPFTEYRVAIKPGLGYPHPSGFNDDLRRFTYEFPEEEPAEWILPVEMRFPRLNEFYQLDLDLETNLSHRFSLRLSLNFGKSDDAAIGEWQWGELTSGTGYLRRTDTFATFSTLVGIKYYLPLRDRKLFYLVIGGGPAWLGSTGSIHYRNQYRGDEQPSSFAVLHRYSRMIFSSTVLGGVEYCFLNWGLLFLEGGWLAADFGRLPGRSSYEIYSQANSARLSGEYRGDRPDSVDLFNYCQAPSSGYQGDYLLFDMSHWYFRVGIGGRF